MLMRGQNFGITSANHMLRLEVPRLTPPSISYQTTRGNEVKPALASWNLAGQSFLRGANSSTFKELPILWFVEEYCPHGSNSSQRIDPPTAESLTLLLRTELDRYKVTSSKGKIVKPISAFGKIPKYNHEDPPETYRNKCNEILESAILGLSDQRPPIILIVLPNRDLRFYPEVKRWGDCQRGIPTVCITIEKLLKGVTDATLIANIW